MRQTAALALVLSLASCTCDPTGYEARTYACQADVDCASGFRCENGVCTNVAAQGGGGGVVGGGGGASGGGSGGGDMDASVACGDRAELCGDEVDDNCNGILDDGCECDAGRPCYPSNGLFGPDLSAPQLHYAWDGGAGCSAGVQECLGNQLAQTCIDVHTPGTEYCDGKDTNCDGVVNLGCPCQAGRGCYPGAPFTNGVGVCRAGTFDCQATQTCVGVNLGGVETCNGLDDDCNGLVDDNLTAGSPCATGVCSAQLKQCTGGVEVACDLTTIPGYAATERCGDGQDNNCNGAVDEGCACDAGSSQNCFTGPANACDGGACSGICRVGAQLCGTSSDGGLGFGACSNQVLPGSEATACADGLDNDCDGLSDCADAECNGRACGSGRTCGNGQCRCVGADGGVSTTEVCTDGVDNTCDMLIDCGDPTCATKSCGANGRKCVGTACTCVAPDGGMGPATELTCGDGVDDDCDGLVDCADSDCTTRTCASGRTCQQSVCTCLGPDAGVPQATETLCNDGVDNDCDGVKDCLDPGCGNRACSASNSAAYCCGTSCTDTSTDPNNCGFCGARCDSNTCARVTDGNRQAGRCVCTLSGGLPDGGSYGCPEGTGNHNQTCSGSTLQCSCNDDDEQCDSDRNGKCGDRACYYP